MKPFPCLLLGLVLSLSPRMEAQSTSMFKASPYAHASVGLSVVDLATGKRVVDYHADQSLTPASVLKLVTTGAALELLEPDFRSKTVLYHTGTVKDGVLDGDLVVRGEGDPGLGSKQLPADPTVFWKRWVEAVRKAGIRRIQGRILADATAFDDEGVSPFWLWEDIGNYYATGVYGLNVNDNSFRLTLRSGAPGSRPEMVGMEPRLDGLRIENHLTAADNDKDSAYLYGAPFQQDMRLYGTMPAHRQTFVIRGQMPDPPTYLAERLKSELTAAGIVVEGQAASSRTCSLPAPELSRTELAVFPSAPLSEQVGIILRKSDNFYAECLLRQLALSRKESPARAMDGVQVLRRFWSDKGLDVGALQQYDGSGLSPNNQVSAAFLAQVLRYMATTSPHARLFEQSLPLAGVEGTVSGFLKGTPLEGKLRLKSGSNQVVNAYAGYYRGNGRNYAVVMIVNHAQADRSRIRKDLETFLSSL